MSGSSQAMRRIEALLDENSFVEIGALVSARTTDFSLKRQDAPSDGVITGYGVIASRLVYIYSQDASVLNGSVGEMHAKKIVRLYELALKCGAPVIGLIDSSGMRLQEATDALYAVAEIGRMQAIASGVIPQVAVVYGGCGGGLAVLSQMCDFTFMAEGGRLFVNAPDAIEGNYREKCDTAAGAFQSEKAGTVDLVCPEEQLAGEVRALMELLPSNNEDDDSYTEGFDDPNRALNGAEALAGDAVQLIRLLADEGLFFEARRMLAPEMTCGLMRLNGGTVGVLANRTEVLDEDGKKKESFVPLLTERGCEKGARFVRMCDAFGIPLLTITHTEGFSATMCEERRSASHAAQLMFALFRATVPKVNLVTKKAYGSAALVMNTVSAGADIRLCWPDAKIGAMEAGKAAKIIGSGKDADALKEIEREYAALQNSAASAGARGYVDEVLEAADTRKYLIGAFEMLYSKREVRPAASHGAV